MHRRGLLVLGAAGAASLVAPRRGLAAEDCAPRLRAEAVGAALLDKYVAALNARDTSSFPEIHTESYIQHSGRSASGLAAQIENFRGIFGRMPDVQARVEDSIIAGDKVVARMSLSATHTCICGTSRVGSSSVPSVTSISVGRLSLR